MILCEPGSASGCTVTIINNVDLLPPSKLRVSRGNQQFSGWPVNGKANVDSRYKHVCISSFLDESSQPQKQTHSPVLVESIDLSQLGDGKYERIKLYFTKLLDSGFNYPSEILAKDPNLKFNLDFPRRRAKKKRSIITSQI